MVTALSLCMMILTFLYRKEKGLKRGKYPKGRKTYWEGIPSFPCLSGTAERTTKWKARRVREHHFALFGCGMKGGDEPTVYQFHWKSYCGKKDFYSIKGSPHFSSYRSPRLNMSTSEITKRASKKYLAIAKL